MSPVVVVNVCQAQAVGVCTPAGPLPRAWAGDRTVVELPLSSIVVGYHPTELAGVDSLHPDELT